MKKLDSKETTVNKAQMTKCFNVILLFRQVYKNKSLLKKANRIQMNLGKVDIVIKPIFEPKSKPILRSINFLFFNLFTHFIIQVSFAHR